MNILLDIGHPAQVHLFRNFYHEAMKRGHNLYVYGRDKDCTLPLLKAYGIPIVGCTHARGKLLWNIIELGVRDFDIWRYTRKFDIDLAMGTSISIAHAGTLCGIPAFIFNEDDLDNVPLLGRIAYPFCTGVVAPSCVRMGRWEHKRIAYEGYQKLAYLHPNWFIPCRRIVEELGIDHSKPYFLVRLTAFNAYHDGGHRGISAKCIQKIMNELQRHGRVLISSERPLPDELEDFRLDIPIEHMHHVMAFARLFVGDSQSMATESALLGVPAFRCNTFAHCCSVLDEVEEKYGLIRSFLPGQAHAMIEAIRNELEDPDSRKRNLDSRNRILADKIDVTTWLLDFAENANGKTRVRNNG